jgi:ERCC4-type nuclease
MIYIDPRKGSGSDGKGNELLQPLIRKLGVPCESLKLICGDACFEGNGMGGPITIGIERKTLHDLLQCIEDARYVGQRQNMLKMYSKGCTYLMVEGMMAPGDGNGFDGLAMQGHRRGQAWGPMKVRGGRTPLYSKLYRYLMSVALSGVIITPSMDLPHTAYNIVEMYHYFQKKWNSHTSLLEVHKSAIPTMDGKPSLTRRWANDITDIGVAYSIAAEKIFPNAHALANSSESDWMRIDGIGPKTARKIIQEIRGWK